MDNPSQVLEAAKAAGFDGADFPGDLKEHKSSDMRQLVDSLGLQVPSVLGAWAYYHAGEDRDLARGDAAATRRGIDYAKRALDLSAELGAQFFEICSAQPAIPQIPFPNLPIATMRNNFWNAAAQICEHAKQYNITILFEPLNMYEGYPGVITRIEDGLRMIDELGLNNLGLQPDVFHLSLSERSICDALRVAGSKIAVVHANESNRRFLGEGHADYAAIFQTLRELGFDGWISVYMPITTQEAAWSARASYGGSGGQGQADARPDLLEMMQYQLQYLKRVEESIA